jgi:hypothetical protein
MPFFYLHPWRNREIIVLTCAQYPEGIGGVGKEHIGLALELVGREGGGVATT